MAILAVLLAALVQDQVENPEFKGWAGFKPGSSVTFQVQVNQKPLASEQKSTLKSVGDSEVVLEVAGIVGGQPAGKAMEKKVAAKVPADKAPKDVKKGEEEIEVAGKKLKCVTMEFDTTTANGKVMHMKVWANEEIPGKTAKVDVSSETFKSTMVATSWEKK